MSKNSNPYGYEAGFTIEQHRDELIDRLGKAIKVIAAKDEEIERLRQKLLLWESEGVLALMAADKMAVVCDDWVKRGLIDARSAFADARLAYCDPYTFKWPTMKAEFAALATPPAQEQHHWVCETCGARYAEYVNGCPKCWHNGEVISGVRHDGSPAPVITEHPATE